MANLNLAKNVGSLLEDAAARHGDRVAIRFIEEGGPITYRELNQQVNRYANALRGEGIGKGDHVAVMLPNCPDYPFIWLALAKLGAVTVALNTMYQPADMAYVVNNSDARALIVHADRLSLYEKAAAKTPAIRKAYLSGKRSDTEMELLSDLAENASDSFELDDIAPDTLMNIQYTSGTTGFPKGCMLSHAYWLYLGRSIGRQMGIEPNDVFLGVAPFYYLDTQWELIMCMLAGATMVVGKKYSASRFMRWVHDFDVTATFATMAAWTYKQPESPLDRDHKLKCMMIGQFPPKLHSAFEKRFNTSLRVGFGMTEVGAVLAVPHDERYMTEKGSVGKVDDFREVKIVDEQGHEVPQGEIGELVIRGPAMMQGYYKKPEETAEVFKDGWFHSGDLFRVDENGHYYISGRKKDMIRRSGENIAAIEVEDTLKSHPKIGEAAVVAVPDEERFEEVKAYIKPAPGETPESIPPEDVIAFCRSKIAEFKVPRYIEYRDHFERTSVGKVIKAGLKGDAQTMTQNCYDRQTPKNK